jgi:hypothetical protein
MKRAAICLVLILMLWPGLGDVAIAADDSKLIAIDILLLPDRTMAQRAKALNRSLRQEYPVGFALDATHVPHITLLQCYVRRSDLGAVIAAVEAALHQDPPKGIELTATGLFDSRLGSVSATGFSVRTTSALARLQQAIAAGLQPLIQHGGTPAAFVGMPQSDTIDWTAAYVDDFLTKSSGADYKPHVTAGIARPDLVEQLTARPFSIFTFTIESAGIFQLGDVGTARKQVWRADPSTNR